MLNRLTFDIFYFLIFDMLSRLNFDLFNRWTFDIINRLLFDMLNRQQGIDNPETGATLDTRQKEDEQITKKHTER
jgi:hypothetical protein